MVRRALSELIDLGVIRAQQGKGAFVRGPILHYRLSTKVTHSENVLREGRASNSALLSYDTVSASREVAEGLSIAPDTLVVAINTVSFADNAPIAMSWNYVPAKLFPAVELKEGEEVSMSAIYAANGLPSYLRLRTFISARLPGKARPWQGQQDLAGNSLNLFI